MMHWGAIARNKKGQLGVVLGWEYDHRREGQLHNFHGVGIRGGNWKSKGIPTYVCENIQVLIRDYKKIQKDYHVA